MMCLLDLALGSLYSLGPVGKKDSVRSRKKKRYHATYSGRGDVSTSRACIVPVYSALEGVDEVVDSFSQSFSPFRLPVEGQEEKPSAESGLETITCKPANDTNRQNKTPTANTRRHVRGMTANTDFTDKTCTHTHTHTHTHTDVVERGQTL